MQKKPYISIVRRIFPEARKRIFKSNSTTNYYITYSHRIFHYFLYIFSSINKRKYATLRIYPALRTASVRTKLNNAP